MSKRDFTPQTLVKNTGSGKIGVVCPDMSGMMNCNGPEEVGVVYEGSTTSSGTDWRDLEIIGPENAVADLDKCGGGQGEKACIFMVVGGDGIRCERFGNLRWSLIFSKMNAKRNPAELFPKCQL